MPIFHWFARYIRELDSSETKEALQTLEDAYNGFSDRTFVETIFRKFMLNVFCGKPRSIYVRPRDKHVAMKMA